MFITNLQGPSKFIINIIHYIHSKFCNKVWNFSRNKSYCHTANKIVGISLVVLMGLWFHIYGCSRIQGRAWRQGNFTVTSWKPIILDVIASFSRTIFKHRCFSRFNVFTVEYLLTWSVFFGLFSLNKPFFGVIFLIVQKVFKFDK